ncbi:hypothetical protein CapIbe_011847 [Capra ibex]
MRDRLWRRQRSKSKNGASKATQRARGRVRRGSQTCHLLDRCPRRTKSAPHERLVCRTLHGCVCVRVPRTHRTVCVSARGPADRLGSPSKQIWEELPKSGQKCKLKCS